MDVELILAECGFDVRIAGSLDQALRLVGEGEIDGAVIDINLQGTTSFPAADALSDADIPFLVLTGHSRDLMPRRHSARPFLQKPYKSGDLIKAVKDLIADPTIGQSAARVFPKSA